MGKLHRPFPLLWHPRPAPHAWSAGQPTTEMTIASWL